MSEQRKTASGDSNEDTFEEGVSRRQILQGTGALALAASLPGCERPPKEGSAPAPAPKGSSADGGTLLVKNIHTLVTMDEQRREIHGGALFVRGNVIEKVGATAELPATANEVLDLQNRYLVMPRMVNTHHHFYQVLTRVVKPPARAARAALLAGLPRACGKAPMSASS
jgi:hypothetical protein